MAAQCPQCGTSLKDDYGMTQCPGCGVFAFVDMDGNAIISSPEPEPSVVIESESPLFEDPNDSFESLEAPEPEFAPIEFQMGISAEEDLPVDIAPSQPSISIVEGTAVEPLPDLGPADDPLGLSDFANSEISSGQNGPLLFRILISGIDTKEIRESIREALEDSRFGWDPDGLLARLDKGNLVIENLAPVKATIIIHRIKRLPVKIRWEQYAITSS
ncbi:MAG TPA: zinc ribbon domain-containing protein [Bdellovibrionales bacterium]|nr:zinc ribbon domain-containing protein [Bdellovibrionales bacterium]